MEPSSQTSTNSSEVNNIVAAAKDNRDTMVIDAIDHIANCIADAIHDLPEEERDKRRVEFVKTFAEGLLLKAKKADNRHKEPAEKSINLYVSYIRPSEEERKLTKKEVPNLLANEETAIEENKFNRFREKLVEEEERRER
jgi:hypothetical protein